MNSDVKAAMVDHQSWRDAVITRPATTHTLRAAEPLNWTAYRGDLMSQVTLLQIRLTAITWRRWKSPGAGQDKISAQHLNTEISQPP